MRGGGGVEEKNKFNYDYLIAIKTFELRLKNVKFKMKEEPKVTIVAQNQIGRECRPQMLLLTYVDCQANQNWVINWTDFLEKIFAGNYL